MSPFTQETARAAAAKRHAPKANGETSGEFLLPDDQDWETMTLAACSALIAELQKRYQRGAEIYNRRLYDENRESFTCLVCQKQKPMATGAGTPNYVWRDDRRDPNTGVLTSRFICTQECFFRGGAKVNAPKVTR